jgi:Holliday junction resolvasome RuvABC endonuclease subunit
VTLSPTTPRWRGHDVGIDVGSRRLAIGWAGREEAYAINLDSKNRWARASELRILSTWLRETLPDDVRLWVERPFLSNGPRRNQNTTISMAETVGVIQAARSWNSVTLIGQSTWKKGACGNGVMSKDEVALWLKTNYLELWRKCLGDQDRMDAMCISIYGMLRTGGLIEPPVPAPKKRKKKRVTSDGPGETKA